jgi:glucosylceramidase
MDRHFISMSRHAGFIMIILVIVISGRSESVPETVSWISTTEGNPWENKGQVPITEWDNDQERYIEIDTATTYQEIDGWGGAINEHGWHAMSVLSQNERDKIIKALFAPSECAINIGRICIGANDFSLTLYSCDDSPGDYPMSDFSLDRDRENVIPFALAAKAVNPEIKFWGAPHSPPAWMKQNNSMIDGSLKTDDATQKAYALYFQKWVQGMDAEGIPIYAVHVQNEPNISGNGYPACVMSGAEMGTLIKDYIGPQFRDNDISTEIWVGTLHSSNPDFQSFYPEYIPPTLGDAEAKPFISGVGMQWNALYNAEELIENYPEIRTMQTEMQCGNFHWMPEYNATAAPNDWGYGFFTFHRIIGWLRAGVNSFCQWNMVLDENGISNSVTNPWPQNAMVTVYKSGKEVRYNPQFYAVKHFSRFIKRGARRIATSGNYSTGGRNLLSENTGEKVTDGDMMAFRNPDGDRILVVRNSVDTAMSVSVKMGTQKFKPLIPAHSMNTFIIGSPLKVVNNEKYPKVQGISVRKTSGSITFTIPDSRITSSAYVSPSVVDAFGRKVTTIRKTMKLNNRKRIVWNKTNVRGEKVAPGVYIIIIPFGGRSIAYRFALP